MNTGRAKKLRRLALQLLLRQGISGGEGRNEYYQEENCVSWEPAIDKNTGMRMRDPDGIPLLASVKKPGTLHCAWKFRAFYKQLKKSYKRKDAIWTAINAAKEHIPSI